MKSNILSILISLLFFTSSFAQNELFVTDLRVNGEIKDYILKDINNDGAKDAVVSFLEVTGDRFGSRYLAVFLQQNSTFDPTPNQIIAMDPDVIGFDLGNVNEDENEELLLIRFDRIQYTTFSKGLYDVSKFRNLISGIRYMQYPDVTFLPHIHIALDLTNRGTDEIVIPNLYALDIYASMNEKARFRQLASLNTSLFSSLEKKNNHGNNVFETTFPTFSEIDFNKDGLKDLVLRRINFIQVYFQNDQGEFSSDNFQPHLIYKYAETEETEIISIKDINKDGIIDLVAIRQTQKDIINNQKRFEFYWGKSTSDKKIAFENRPNQVVTGQGLILQYALSDINGDGYFDLSIMQSEINVANVFSNFLNNSAGIKFKLFIQNDSRFPSTPTFEKDVDHEIDLRVDFKRYLMFCYDGDIDGDGLKDMLISDDTNNLLGYLGNSNTYLSSSKSFSQQLPVPYDGNRIMVDQVFSPTKHDVIFTYGYKDSPALKGILRILTK